MGLYNYLGAVILGLVSAVGIAVYLRHYNANRRESRSKSERKESVKSVATTKKRQISPSDKLKKKVINKTYIDEEKKLFQQLMQEIEDKEGDWKEKLLHSFKSLVETDLYLVIDECYSENVITYKEMEDLECCLTVSDKNRYILMILSRKSLDTFIKFLKCLTTDSADQTHILNIILEADTSTTPAHGNTGHMRRQIYRNHEDIVNNTAIKDLTDEFISRRIFEIGDSETVSNASLNTTEKNKKFLDILLKKEESLGYPLLLSTLREIGHSELVEQIEATDVDKGVDKEIEWYLRKVELENAGSHLELEEISFGKLMSWKADDEMFLPTKVTEHIYNEAKNASKVIVCGLPGTGKSANIHHIALRLKKEGYRLCCVQGIKEMVDKFDKFGQYEKQVYIADDIFGLYGEDMEAIKEWGIRHNNDIKRCLFGSNVIFLCSSRLQVIQDERLSNIKEHFTLIDISQREYELSSEERVTIFRNHAEANQRDDLLTEEVLRRVSNIDCPFGCFPLVCRLYIADKGARQSIEDYFQKPLNVIDDHLKMLRTEDPLRHFCLLLCLIYENNLQVDAVQVVEEQEDSTKLRQELLEVCELPSSTSRQTIRKKIDTLLQTFMKMEGDTYHFVHDIIQDAMFKHVSRLDSDIHKMFLSWCTSKFVMHRIRLSTVDCKDSEYVINLRPDVFQAWGRRVLQIIHEGIALSNRIYQHMNDGYYNENGNNNRIDNPWKDVFAYNPSLQSPEGERNLAEALCKQSRPSVLVLMCTLGYSLWYGSFIRHTGLHWAVYYGFKHIVDQIIKSMSRNEIHEVESICGLFCVRFEAAQFDLDMIQTLISHGVDFNKRNEHGRTLLWSSVDVRDYQKASLLVTNGADVNICNQSGWSPLFLSVYNEDYKIAKLLIDHGANINLCNERGMTPLWHSLRNNDYQMAALLLEHGADVNQMSNGIPLLYRSVCINDYQATDLLIKHGADVNVCDEESGESSLSIMLWNNEGRQITELLLIVAQSQKDDSSSLFVSEMPMHQTLSEIPFNVGFINNKDYHGRTLLSNFVDTQDYEKSKLLLKMGADVNQKGQWGGWSPLNVSVYNGDYQTTELLISHGANVNHCNEWGLSPLYQAVNNRDYQTMELLINHGADVNQCDNYGTPLLYQCLLTHNEEAVKLLIKQGADVIKSDKESGELPLFVSLWNNDWQTTELLLKYGTGVNQSQKNGRAGLYLQHPHGHSLLLDSVDEKDYEKAESLIASGEDVNQCNRYGWSPLNLSVYNEDYQMAKLLINHRANINHGNERGISPLWQAVYNRDHPTIELLIQCGADVNECDNYGTPLLYRCLYMKDYQTTELLIQQGADVNKCDNESGESPLLLSVGINDYQIVESLIKHGADLNLRDRSGRSALYISQLRGHENISELLQFHGALCIYKGKQYKDLIEIPDIMLHDFVLTRNHQKFDLLTKQGADVNQSDEEGETPLHLSVLCDDYQTTEVLIKLGADVNHCGERTPSPLYQSVWNKDYQTTELLLKHGADVNGCNTSPLLRAVENMDRKTTELLINHGADVNMCDKAGISPLYLSVSKNDDPISELLIENGADVNHCDDEGESPLHCSVSNGNYDLTELLINHGAEVDKFEKKGGSLLHLSVAHADKTTTKLLIQHGADVNMCDKKGQSPLFRSMSNEDDTTTEILVINGADVNQCDAEGVSLLSLSVSKKYYLTTKLLVNHGADVNKCGRAGISPLYMSVLRNDYPTSELLIENGADFNQCDDEGESPLQLSVSNGNYDLTELLINHGADVHTCEKKGGSLLYLSVSKETFYITKLLIDHGADVNLCRNGRSVLYLSQLNNEPCITQILLLHKALCIYKGVKYNDIFDIPNDELEPWEMTKIQWLKQQIMIDEDSDSEWYEKESDSD